MHATYRTEWMGRYVDGIRVCTLVVITSTGRSVNVWYKVDLESALRAAPRNRRWDTFNGVYHAPPGSRSGAELFTPDEEG